MSDHEAIEAWKQREALCWLNDEDLRAAVEVAQGFLQCEAMFVGQVQVIVAAMGSNPFDQSPEEIAGALLYLARHGVPDGIPSAG